MSLYYINHVKMITLWTIKLKFHFYNSLFVWHLTNINYINELDQTCIVRPYEYMCRWSWPYTYRPNTHTVWNIFNYIVIQWLDLNTIFFLFTHSNSMMFVLCVFFKVYSKFVIFWLTVWFVINTALLKNLWKWFHFSLQKNPKQHIKEMKPGFNSQN